jgi:hypothetical protein
VTINEEERISSADLLNFSAVHVILKGGQVFLLNEADMPDATSALNAVFRYRVVSA